MNDYIQNPYDGDKWEKIIDDCYRPKHQCDGCCFEIKFDFLK